MSRFDQFLKDSLVEHLCEKMEKEQRMEAQMMDSSRPQTAYNP